jgi:hypothetical protein
MTTLTALPRLIVSWDGTLDYQNTYSWSDDAMDQMQILADLRRGQGTKELVANYIKSRKTVLEHICGVRSILR